MRQERCSPSNFDDFLRSPVLIISKIKTRYVCSFETFVIVLSLQLCIVLKTSYNFLYVLTIAEPFECLRPLCEPKSIQFANKDEGQRRRKHYNNALSEDAILYPRLQEVGYLYRCVSLDYYLCIVFHQSLHTSRFNFKVTDAQHPYNYS